MKVALIGTHGTGKTTLVHEIVAEIKKQGINVGFLGEIVRACPFPVNENQTKDTSNWIIYTQYIKELELKDKCDILICDRSILDAYVYRFNLFGKDELLEKFVKEKIKEYNLLFRVPIDHSRLKNDNFRSTNQSFQRTIDKKFNELESLFKIKSISSNNVKYIKDTIIKNYT